MIEYKKLIFDEEQILNLYLDNEWYAYTQDPNTLYRGIKNSTDKIGAYDGDKLVGLIRSVSDKETICYIQDILVLQDYHRKGIGTNLMKLILDKYQGVRQINLATDQTEKQRAFYESLGFIDYNDKKILGFSFNRAK